MAIAAAWIICVVTTAVVLFLSSAKNSEVREVNYALLDALADLVNALEQHPVEFSDYINTKIEDGREVVECYDEYQLTIDTLPR